MWSVTGRPWGTSVELRLSPNTPNGVCVASRVRRWDHEASPLANGPMYSMHRASCHQTDGPEYVCCPVLVLVFMLELSSRRRS